MAHYAKILNDKVLQVIVAEPEFFQTFVDSSPGTWLQCSYNARGGVHYGPDGQPDDGLALRMNYPGIGWNYDAASDAFYESQPFPSWTLKRNTFLWEAPVPRPSQGNWNWNETRQLWEQP
jgi:hypothetical protein